MPKKLFITISPPERSHAYAQLGFVNPIMCVYLDDKMYIQKFFSKYKIKTFIFYPELDKTGRLHWHGKVSLTSSQEYSFYKSIKPKLQRYIGFVKSEEITSFKEELRTLLYCQKDWSKTSQIISYNEKLPMSTISPLYSKPSEVSHKLIDNRSTKPSILDFFLA